MGPVMSARNIALLRSHWTSTILPISVSQTQRSAGLLFGAAHGVFGSCHLRPLSDRQFPELPFESNPGEGGLSLRCAFRLPGGTQAIAVPFLRQPPALLQAQDATPRPIPLFAPTIHMLLRPEQKHGFSREDNHLAPAIARSQPSATSPNCSSRRTHRSGHFERASQGCQVRPKCSWRTRTVCRFGQERQWARRKTERHATAHHSPEAQRRDSRTVAGEPHPPVSAT